MSAAPSGQALFCGKPSRALRHTESTDTTKSRRPQPEDSGLLLFSFACAFSTETSCPYQLSPASHSVRGPSLGGKALLSRYYSCAAAGHNARPHFTGHEPCVQNRVSAKHRRLCLEKPVISRDSLFPFKYNIINSDHTSQYEMYRKASKFINSPLCGIYPNRVPVARKSLWILSAVLSKAACSHVRYNQRLFIFRFPCCLHNCRSPGRKAGVKPLVNRKCFVIITVHGTHRLSFFKPIIPTCVLLFCGCLDNWGGQVRRHPPRDMHCRNG